MTAGFYVKNDTGTFQIDDTYQNYHLVEKGVATTNAAAKYVNGSAVEISYSGVNPIIAIASTNYAYTSKTVRTGSTTTFTINVYASKGAAFTYYVFDVLGSEMEDHGFGLVVRNGAGEITFSSAHVPLLIEDLVQKEIVVSAPPNGPSSETDHLYDAARQYAVLHGLIMYKAISYISGGNPMIRYSTSAWKTISGGVRFCEYASSWVQVGNYLMTNRRTVGVIVDVTYF